MSFNYHNKELFSDSGKMVQYEKPYFNTCNYNICLNPKKPSPMPTNGAFRDPVA